MTRVVASEEELIRKLKTFENSETKELFVDEVIEYLEVHCDHFKNGRAMLEFFKSNQERLLRHFETSRQPITYKDKLPNGRPMRIVGISHQF